MNFHYAMSKTIGGKFKIKNSTRKGLQVGLKAYQKAFLRIIIKGAGGSEVDFHFLVVSDRGECQLPGTFYGMKKYCS